MSQHIILCPNCNQKHEVDAFRSAGVVKMLVAMRTPDCDFETGDKVLINKLLGIEETHRQRILNQEMPKHEY